jgi:hypothetical protein
MVLECCEGVPTYEKKVYELDPAALGIPPCTIEDLKGGTTTNIHTQRCKGSGREMIVLPHSITVDAELMCPLGFDWRALLLHSTCVLCGDSMCPEPPSPV